MKLYLAIAIVAAFSSTLADQTSEQAPIQAPQRPTIELLEDIPVPAAQPIPGPAAQPDSIPADSIPALTPLQRRFPGHGGEAIDDKSVTGVYFMTNLNTSGAGSLAAAPSNAYIVPLVAGEIKSDTTILMAQNNVRFLGQLAPGRISIDGSTVFNREPLVEFRGSNALWEYLTLKAGDVNLTEGKNISHSPFTVRRGAVGVVMANVSVYYGDDDSGSTWDPGTSDVTFYRMLIALAADRGALGGNVDYGMLSGGGSANITYFQNIFVTDGRAPNMTNTRGQVDNNITYTTSGVTNQMISFSGQSGIPQAEYNYTNNLDIRPAGGASTVWLGQSNSQNPFTHTLEAYLNNNNYRSCTSGYIPMGTATTTSFNDAGTNVSGLIADVPFSQPTLPSITDPAILESTLIPVVGNSLHRESIDTDVISIVSTCAPKPNETTASNYYSDPWPTGPTKAPINIWDTTSPDGLSDSAKAVFGLPPGTNLLSPNDGRWEAVVQYHTGLLLIGQ